MRRLNLPRCLPAREEPGPCNVAPAGVLSYPEEMKMRRRTHHRAEKLGSVTPAEDTRSRRRVYCAAALSQPFQDSKVAGGGQRIQVADQEDCIVEFGEPGWRWLRTMWDFQAQG